ncbi:FdhF/YdeP family oxidoreductase [Leptolyngbya sp. 7M]|uniref:FdhF/YdeP family oxidoreductase n=1 Tax=Leptolyngbya sp. 7M TaxID=2812896 RepID=UPI001B8CCEA3|nr:FdhF/YdeP family oxidoreductase [Leptolyngbya sp. 7M]QYO65873.1 FdhF/YdeP family oxidoreductase [Leptolyngbya sp. 7M]
MANGDNELKITPPPETSAGIHAVTNALRHVFSKMGVIRGTRGLLKLNQKGGIDCQSCAWPDPERRTINEFCENGAKALSDEATTAKIGREFFAAHSIEELRAKSDFWLNKQGRLTEPLMLREGGMYYEPISWEDAISLIAEKLNSLSSPDEAVFYTSGRTSNEAAFLYQLFVRQYGTNNLPDCSNMCHESTSVALSESIGLGKATIRLEDFERTDLIIVIGQNPGTNAPRMLSSLAAAKKAGAKMIAINPLSEVGLTSFVDPNPQHGNPFNVLGFRPAKLADLHLPVRIGGDMAVLKGLMKVLLERERAEPGSVFDHAFIAKHTEGYDELISSLDAAGWSEIKEGSGLTREQIEEAAEMILNAGSFITCWAMGVTQHTAAVATIQDIVNLHLLRGSIGRPGAGLCPVRGHSNVQGDRTMGIWEKMTPVFRENLEREFNFKTPERDGYNTVESIAAMQEGKAKVFFAIGGNFAAASPDTNAVESALQKCDLTVQVITKLNRTALAPGKVSLILPCLGRSEVDEQAGREQFVSTESTMLNVQMSRGVFEPASRQLRSEVWIVCRLAKATLSDRSGVDWDAFAANYDLIRDAIERVVPGFDNYNERIRKPGGFYLPNPPRERIFPTASDKALFRTSSLEYPQVPAGRLLMTTIRSHDQFNTTIYGFDDRYRGIDGGRMVIFMNADDIADLGLLKGQQVDVTSYWDDGERYANGFAIVEYKIPKGCVAAYFPEANPLVPLGSHARRSGTPTSKCIVVSIRPSG